MSRKPARRPASPRKAQRRVAAAVAPDAVSAAVAERAREARESSAMRHNLANAAARDIGAGWDAEEPSPAEVELRERCRLDLRLFLESYFPECFRLGWSPDHLRIIAKIQLAALSGGMVAVAMPRGDGKTSILERAALWAMLYGHHAFVCVVGAAELHAAAIRDAIKTELETNERLRRPFRAACYPIRCLRGEARRCVGQTLFGERTRIQWGDDELVLPTVPGAESSGAVLSACGITGALRGQKMTRHDGRVIRPTFVLVDDPQTRESAMSPTQVAERLAILRGDLLGLPGPGAKIAAFAAVTVIRDGDLADQLLDRVKHPEWHGERIPAVKSWPTNNDLWAKYETLWREAQALGDPTTARATEFYRRNRKAMDAGGEVSWKERVSPGELSAIQHMFNKRLDLGESAFSAEFQNKPVRAGDDGLPQLTAAEIAGKVSAMRRGEVPAAAQLVTAFIDVHDQLLFWAACAWSGQFDGWVVDYGTYPEQPTFTTMRRAARVLSEGAPGAGREGAIRAGIDELAAALTAREWRRTDGAVLRAQRVLVDSGYVPDVVHDACRSSPGAAVLMPSRGRHVGPKHKPIEEFDRRPGERVGFKWHIPQPARGRTQRVLVFDSNYWKSFVHARLGTPVGDVGCLQLWGSKPREHEVFASHLVGEYPTRVTANGRTVDEWEPRPAHENHWLDCVVGCAVAASEQGCQLPAAGPIKPKRQRVSLAALARTRRLTRETAVEAPTPDETIDAARTPDGRLSLNALRALRTERSQDAF